MRESERAFRASERAFPRAGRCSPPTANGARAPYLVSPHWLKMRERRKRKAGGGGGGRKEPSREAAK